MPRKTVIANVGSDRLIVENTWISGARLFHNEKLIAANDCLVATSKTTPFMTATVEIDGVKSIVDVYVYALFTVKIQIKLNNQFIGGTRF